MAFEKFASDGADDFLPGSIDSPLVGSSPSLNSVRTVYLMRAGNRQTVPCQP